MTNAEAGVVGAVLGFGLIALLRPDAVAPGAWRGKKRMRSAGTLFRETI